MISLSMLTLFAASGGWWVHDLNPVLWQISDVLAVRWYGLAYVAGFMGAYGLLRFYFAKSLSPLTPAHLESLFLHLILGVMIGGRLGYLLLYQTADFTRDPLLFFRFWQGGMASHGGFAGVLIAVVIFSYRQGLSMLRVGDMVCCVASLGIFFGRIANFINGELWGTVSEVPWAVIFPEAGPDPRHPSQLYAAALEGLVLFGAMQWLLFRTRAVQHPGMLAGVYYIGYALMRFLSEYFREPDAALILGLSRGTFYSFAILLVGGMFVIYALKRTPAAHVRH